MVAEANPAIRAVPRSSMRTFFWNYSEYSTATENGTAARF